MRNSNGTAQKSSIRRWRCPFLIADTNRGETRTECNRSWRADQPRPIPLKLYWLVIAFPAESGQECLKCWRSNRKYKRKEKSSRAAVSNRNETTINRKRSSWSMRWNPWSCEMHYSYILLSLSSFNGSRRCSSAGWSSISNYPNGISSMIFDVRVFCSQR